MKAAAPRSLPPGGDGLHPLPQPLEEGGPNDSTHRNHLIHPTGAIWPADPAGSIRQIRLTHLSYPTCLSGLSGPAYPTCPIYLTYPIYLTCLTYPIYLTCLTYPAGRTGGAPTPATR